MSNFENSKADYKTKITLYTYASPSLVAVAEISIYM